MFEINDETKKIIKKATKGKKNIRLTIGYLSGDTYTIRVYDENGEVASPEKYNYEIGSITKTFTTSLLAKYVEENKMSLDDSVLRYITGLNKEDYYPTLIRLATHTSGYSQFLPLSAIDYAKIVSSLIFGNGDMKSNNPLWMDFNKMKNLIIKNNLEDKDYNFKYSNFGMSLIGYCVGQVSRKGYFNTMNDFIQNDLGLNNTYLGITCNTINGYDNKNNNCGNWEWGLDNNIMAAGGITSNAEDLLKYAKMNINDEKSYFKECHKKRNSCKKHDMGLGWFLKKENNNIIYHQGGTGCFSSFLGYDKEKNIAAVVLSNYKLGLNEEAKLGFGLINSLT